MSEIDGPKFSVNQVNFRSIQKQNVESEPASQQETVPQLSDFSDSKAETIGRSMLFKGVDDVNNDLKAIIENPQIAENSDKMFETAFKAAQDAGVENPYEEAATFSTGRV